MTSKSSRDHLSGCPWPSEQRKPAIMRRYGVRCTCVERDKVSDVIDELSQMLDEARIAVHIRPRLEHLTDDELGEAFDRCRAQMQRASRTASSLASEIKWRREDGQRKHYTDGRSGKTGQ